MRKILSIFVLASTFCFTFTESTIGNLQKAYDIHKKEGKTLEAIGLLTACINDPSVPNVEKVHYLNFRSGLYQKLGMFDQSEVDCAIIKNLCFLNPKCREEMFQHYEGWQLQKYDISF